MADFTNLPLNIQRVAELELNDSEKICMCVLAGSSLLHPDIMLITSLRVLVLDEKFMGSLAVSYANIRCNVFFSEILGVKITRFSKHKLFGQARLEINVKRNTYWIDNMRLQDARRAHQLITEKIWR
ncbi:MAG: PH domain-containing protein [Candidatus Poribacteria bacterium]|nr:PH domain-containing protein [Candidatus Poribacteria bacterium]